MEKDVRKLVDGYKKFTGSDVKVHKTPVSTVTTLCKSEIKETTYIYKYRSIVVQIRVFFPNY